MMIGAVFRDLLDVCLRDPYTEIVDKKKIIILSPYLKKRNNDRVWRPAPYSETGEDMAFNAASVLRDQNYDVSCMLALLIVGSVLRGEKDDVS